MKRPNPILAAATAVALLAPSALGGELVPAGTQIKATPPPGATDLEASFWVKDTTFTAGSESATANQGTAAIQNATPTSFDAIYDNGGNPYTAAVNFGVNFTLNSSNQVWYSYDWTQNGVPMPGGGGGGPGVGPGGGAGVVPGAHVGGWNVSNPVLISTVSNLYAHTITVYNPGNTPETISDLSAFASMSFVTSDQLSTLDYGTPLVSSVVLAPDSSTSVNLITSGDMGGGEIYLSYVTDDSDPWYTFGEHPIPEPSNLAMLGLGTLVLLTYEWRRLKAKA